MNRLELIALPGIPRVHAGDNLADLLHAAFERASLTPRAGDVLVIAQKIISKAEGRLVPLADVTPSDEALALAAETAKDPRLVELILRESTSVVRKRPGTPEVPGVIVVEHLRGWVHANAGIDQSNVTDSEEPVALLLPKDPDASARALRASLEQIFGVALGVVINDSAGRAWRIGTCGIALGSAGITALQDLRGAPDMFGRTLEVSVVGRADEIAAAASLVMGQADEAMPAVIVRGLPSEDSPGTAQDLIRPAREDLFR